ncbi:MAG: hypothetical protein JXB34_05105 [Bacteroidales bacterium]|nr:hypothetical protein [Bacteroidales bacterium]
MLTVFFSRYSFFWDTIQLASSHAHFFYNNNLEISLLPDSIDSGHLPAFGYFLAMAWSVFGKTLVVSHFFMLPFLFGIVYQTYRLCKYLFPGNIYLPMLVILAEPTLLAQSTMVSPDIPLMFFFVLLLNEILQQGKYLKLLAVIGLSLASMRGWMAALILFVFDIIIQFSNSKKNFRQIAQNIMLYLPGGTIAIIFLFVHFSIKGWIVYHPASPWASCFEKVDFNGYIRNIGIYIWRLIDFGRIVFWVLALVYLKKIAGLFRSDMQFRQIIVLLLLFILIFPLNILPYKQLTQHRYFLPIYFLTALSIVYFLVYIRKKALLAICILILLAGNYIPYPDTIARGWDSTLAYIPYNNLRKNIIGYLKENNIPPEEVKCWFPNTAPAYKIDLVSSDESFSSLPLDSCNYCFYSNVFNDVSDEEYNIIHKTWIPVYKMYCMGVKTGIFRNPETTGEKWSIICEK